MNIRPTVGIESEDAYLNAKEKFCEFMRAADQLTPKQRECLARELADNKCKRNMLQLVFAFIENEGGQ